MTPRVAGHKVRPGPGKGMENDSDSGDFFLPVGLGGRTVVK